MSIPECASAARFPSAENTVENLFHALLPQRLSKCASPTAIATGVPPDSKSKPVSSRKSWRLLLDASDDDSIQCSDDESTDDHSCNERVCTWDSKDAASSLGDSEEDSSEASSFGNSEEETEAPSHAEPIPVPPSALRRRSSVMQTSQQQLCQGFQDISDAVQHISTTRSGSKPSPGEDQLPHIRLLNPDDFVKFLLAHHVPVQDYGRDKARCLQDLWAEVVVGECSLERIPSSTGPRKCCLQRRVRTLVLEVQATIEGQDKFILLKREVDDHGHTRDHLDARVTTKMFDDEDFPSAMQRCLLQNLGMECSLVEDVFAIESEEDFKAVCESTAYPGLRTVYTMHVVRMRARDASHPKMAALGLPQGGDFTAEMMVSALGVGKRLTWCWCMPDVMKAAERAKQGRRTSPPRAARPRKVTWSDDSFSLKGSGQEA